MILSILTAIKAILFIILTEVEYNHVTIFLISSLICFLIFSLIYFSKVRYKKYIAFSFYIIVSLLMFADVIYYGHFQDLPSIVMLKQAKQLTAVGDSISNLINFKNLLLIIDLPFTLYYIIKEKEMRRISKSKQVKILLISLSMILVISFSFMFQGKFQTISNQEFFTYHMGDIFNNLNSETYTGGTLDEQLDIAVLNLVEEDEEIKGARLKGIGRDKNLIVLQIEALQNFVINLNYEGQDITPNLNKLIKDTSTIYYDDYHQLLGRGNTSDAEFVSQNSLHPSMEEPTYTQYEQNTFYGLPWILRDNGYNAWVFHGYEKTFWNREKAYVNQGYERFLSQDDYKFTETIGFGIKDEDFYDQTIDYLKELDNLDDNPFYAFIISLTSHTPFAMPPKYEELNIRSEHKETMLGDYLQSIHYADKYLGKFIEDLKEEGLYDNTVIALYGDHFGISNSDTELQKIVGDLLGEFYHYDSIMNVPLIIHVPGEDINETISTIGSHIDFSPTIVNIMGYENEKGIMLGNDLTNYKGYNFVAPQTYMRKGSFIDDEYLFTISKSGLFEQSSAINRITRENVEVESLRERYDMVIKEISISDTILKNDLLKDYIADKGEIGIKASSNLNIEDKPTIKEFFGSTLEQLTKEYDSGNKFLSITYDPKENSDYKLNIEKLADWLTSHDDAYILLRAKEDNVRMSNMAKKLPVKLKDRFIVELKEYEDYYYVNQDGFKNIMFNFVISDYTNVQILDLTKSSTFYGLIIDEERANTDLPVILKEEVNVETYIKGQKGTLVPVKLPKN